METVRYLKEYIAGSFMRDLSLDVKETSNKICIMLDNVQAFEYNKETLYNKHKEGKDCHPSTSIEQYITTVVMKDLINREL